jgi:hypothetical protein
MGMFDMMRGGIKAAGQVGPKMMGPATGPGMPQKQGIGPSVKSQAMMRNKGQMGQQMGQGNRMGQMPMQQMPQMPMKQPPMQMPQETMQQPAQWNQPLPETSSQMRQPMGPSPDQIQQLMQMMQARSGNTGFRGPQRPMRID